MATVTFTDVSNATTPQLYVVPANCVFLDVTAKGAGGAAGANSGGTGGSGGYAACRISVTPGETLQIVGGPPTMGGDGNYGNTQEYGGRTANTPGTSTGGGYAGVFRGSPSQGTALIVAGGGGTGGDYYGAAGGAGGQGGGSAGSSGTAGTAGSYSGGGAGGGGGPTSGGVAGGGFGAGITNSPYSGGAGGGAGTAGSAMFGGEPGKQPSSNGAAGGGGGGGFWGGGGGGEGTGGGGGGGGGSSYASGTSQVLTAGGGAAAGSAGSIVLVEVFDAAPNTPTSPSPASGALTGSTGSLAVSAVVSDPDGGTVSARFRYSTDSTFASGVVTVTGTSVTSGGTSTATLTGLAQNTHYYMRVDGYDGILYSASYALTDFWTNRPPTAPTVTAPAAGATVNTTYTITWTAGTDPESQALTYSLDYSRDNGATWVSIATGVSGTLRLYDFSAVAATTTALIRIRSVDPGGLTSAYAQSGVFTIVHNTAPSAPTLVSPAGSATVDASSGVAFTGTYNPTDGSNQNAYALRIKTSGAYSYWNAGTAAMQSTIVWNPVSTAPGANWTVTLPAAAVPNGSVYNWSLASQEAGGSLQGVFAGDATFTAQAGPTVTVTAPSGSAVYTQPVVTWTTTPAAGATQTTWRLVVESGAYGLVPGTGTSAYDSGVVTDAVSQQATVGSPLTNGVQYRAFVQVGQTGAQTSGWAFVTFTVSLDPPAPPTLTATYDPQAQTTSLLAVGASNLLSANAASIETDASGWAAGANTTLARNTTHGLNGASSLSLTATAAGAMSASTPTGTAGFPVAPGGSYAAVASWLAAATVQPVGVTVYWWQSSGAASAVRASDASPATSDLTSGWTQAASVGLIAPSDAAYASLTLTSNASAAAEVHYADAIGLRPNGNATWYRGGLAAITTALIERSDDGGVTWVTVRGGDALALPLPSQQSALLVDQEFPPNATTQYRATAQATV